MILVNNYCSNIKLITKKKPNKVIDDLIIL